MNPIEQMLAESRLFQGLDRKFLEPLVACATQVRFKAGDYIFREGDASKIFYVLRTGRVSVEINIPGRGPTMIETLGEGDLLSWSWLVPPYEKHFDARAVELTRAVAMDGERIRSECERDSSFGYQLLKRVSTVMGQRLSATRLQLLDLYSSNG